jgi:hypothetical protein
MWLEVSQRPIGSFEKRSAYPQRGQYIATSIESFLRSPDWAGFASRLTCAATFARGKETACLRMAAQTVVSQSFIW